MLQMKIINYDDAIFNEVNFCESVYSKKVGEYDDVRFYTEFISYSEFLTYINDLNFLVREDDENFVITKTVTKIPSFLSTSPQYITPLFIDVMILKDDDKEKK